MATGNVPYLKERSYLAVSFTHFSIDVLNSGRNLLVALLAVSLGLTNAQVGIAFILYNVGNALSQPLFGWLADRIGARLLIVGGTGWMIFFFSISALADDWWALIALTCASLGSGMFHPTGTMVASQTSRTHRNQATAFFFMAGQLGLFLGPVLTGILVQAYGRPGFIVLPLLTLFAFAGSWRWLSATAASTKEIPLPLSPSLHARPRRGRALPRGLRLQMALLAMIILPLSTLSTAAISYAPKLFTELGYAESAVGWLSGFYMMGSAVGGLFGGTLGDRIPAKHVILLGAAGFILPAYFYIAAPFTLQGFLLLLTGFFGGMPHTILVLKIQSLFPQKQAMASGLALGAMFFGGSVGGYFVGIVADLAGLARTLQWAAFLPVIAFCAALLLRELRPATSQTEVGKA